MIDITCFLSPIDRRGNFLSIGVDVKPPVTPTEVQRHLLADLAMRARKGAVLALAWHLGDTPTPPAEGAKPPLHSSRAGFEIVSKSGDH